MNTAHRSISPVLFLLLAVSGAGFVAYDTVDRLRTNRPEAKETPEELVADNLQNISARLWMDPFTAFHASGVAKDHMTDGQRETAEKKLQEMRAPLLKNAPENGDCLALGVVVNGRWYPEDIEQRIRFRHAIVAALAKLNYRPNNAECLGCMTFKDDLQWPGITCPFELFQSDGATFDISIDENEDYVHATTPKNLLLYWIDEEKTGEQTKSPLLRLHKICSTMHKTLSNKDAAPPITLRQAILATTGSGFLQRIYDNDISIPNDLEEIPVLACCATASIPNEDKSPQNTKGPFCVQRTIGMDEDLAEAILAELKCRGIQPTKNCYPMMLISEFDTLYGRELPKTIVNKISSSVQQDIPIFCVKYFRGIDGAQPLNSAFVADSGSNADTSPNHWAQYLEKWTESTPRDNPIGSSQYDYIRRIASAFFRHQQFLQEIFETKEGTIRSIGILGSDVYDKLLLLQALRPLFPEALFFTTDLDVLFIQPDHNALARGMMIATHFGPIWTPAATLNPCNDGPRVQNLFSPFRDCYQTACFRSALLAVLNNKALFADRTPPKVFEVGRTGFFECRMNPEGASKTSDDAQNRAPKSDSAGNPPSSMASSWASRIIQKASKYFFELTHDRSLFAFFPLWYSKEPACVTAGNADLSIVLMPGKARFVLGSLFLIVLYGVAWTMVTRPWDSVFSSRTNNPFLKVPNARARSRTLFFLAVLPILWGTLTFLCFRMGWNDVSPEHTFGLEGISIWPRLHLHVLAIILSAAFMMRMRMTLRANNSAIQDAPFFGPPNTAARKLNEKPSRWAVCLSRGTLLRAAKRLSGQSKSARSFWDTYLFYDRSKHRLARVLPWCLFMALLWALAAPYPWQDHASAHIRGENTQTVAAWAQFGAYLGLMLLTLGVFDAVSLCRRFVEAIVLPKLTWYGQTPEKQRDGDEEWVALELIARRTQVIQSFLYYPFVVLFVLWLANNSLFETYSGNRQMNLLFIVPAVLTFGAVWILRRSAEQARQTLLTLLHNQQMRLRLSREENVNDKARLACLEETETTIRDCTMGAFGTWAENPLIGSLILPFGGAGAIQLIEYILRAVQ